MLPAVLLFAISAVSAVYAQPQHVAIVNAGSSGSRLHVYAVDKSDLTVEELFAGDLGMTLTDVTSTAAATDFYGRIARAYRPAKPAGLYILATAGMRADPHAETIYGYLCDCTAPEPYALRGAMTITGRYEGLYAWIAANYEANRLPGRNGRTTADAQGILEIGGASMQLAFVPKDEEPLLPTDTIRHARYGVVYSRSYMQGGVNAVYQGTRGDSTRFERHAAGLSALPAKFIAPTCFSGLGGTINGIAAKAGGTGFVRAVNATADSGAAEDERTHYKSNAVYLRWVLVRLGLFGDTGIRPRKADWTQGAAYDIVIDGRAPERFDRHRPL